MKQIGSIVKVSRGNSGNWYRDRGLRRSRRLPKRNLNNCDLVKGAKPYRSENTKLDVGSLPS